MTERVVGDTPSRAQLQGMLDALRELDVVVAKNPNLSKSLQEGGDWDLLAQNIDEAERAIRDLAGVPCRYTRRTYVRALHYRWGDIDLLPDLQWRGLCLLNASEVLRNSFPPSGGDLKLPTASVTHQFVAGCIYPLLAHGTYKTRYLALLDDPTFNWVELRRVIEFVFGNIIGAENDNRAGLERSLLKMPGIELRRRALVTSYRRAPKVTASLQLRFYRRELSLRMSRLFFRLLGVSGRNAITVRKPVEPPQKQEE